MNKFRLEALSDGIFAIVMTLLVIEIHVPSREKIMQLAGGSFSEEIFWHELTALTPLFLSFFLSFAVLVSYWVLHNFTITFMAKNVDRHVVYLNMLFMAFVSLVPFSSNMLGEYSDSRTAVAVYSANMLVISVMLSIIRTYVIKSEKIENPSLDSINFTDKDRLYSAVRMNLPIVCSILAIILSYFYIPASIFLLLIPVIIGVSPGLLGFIMRTSGIEQIFLKKN